MNLIYKIIEIPRWEDCNSINLGAYVTPWARKRYVEADGSFDDYTFGLDYHDVMLDLVDEIENNSFMWLWASLNPFMKDDIGAN